MIAVQGNSATRNNDSKLILVDVSDTVQAIARLAMTWILRMLVQLDVTGNAAMEEYSNHSECGRLPSC